MCVYGDSSQARVVALLVPDRVNLQKLADQLGKAGQEVSSLCRDEDMTEAVLRELVSYGRQLRLEKFELPGAVTLCGELWTPDTDMVMMMMIMMMMMMIMMF